MFNPLQVSGLKDVFQREIPLKATFIFFYLTVSVTVPFIIMRKNMELFHVTFTILWIVMFSYNLSFL